MKSESQVVLNTPTEHNFQDAFKKKRRKCWEQFICMEEDYFKSDDGH
jgi:hypothetical protein